MTAVSGFTNGVVEIKSEDMVRVGTAHVGDVGGSTGAQAVTGYFTSASTASGGSTTTLSVVYPDLGFVPIVIISNESLNSLALDNDVKYPVVDDITSTGFSVFYEETVASVQNIQLMAVLFYEFI